MIEPLVRDMARGGNFAAFTTMLPDGMPMTHVMWIDADETHLLVNTATHRTKFRNVLRNPLVGVAIGDRQDAYRYAEVRGRVVDIVRGDAAGAHIDLLSHRYLGRPYIAETADRAILRIEPTRQRAKITMAEPLPERS